MTPAAPWEDFLAAHFPGYLLPEAARRALPEHAAARFLARLDGPRERFFLRAAGVVAARAGAIRTYALEALPALAARLPARVERTRCIADGALRGRLDVPATLRLRHGGRSTALVGVVPERRRDRPEDALAKAVATRLVDTLGALSAAGVLGEMGWGAAVAPCAAALAHVLDATALREVLDVPHGAASEEAAHASPHPAHVLAADLSRALREGLDDPDPRRVARVVAEGALLPLADHARFELAVLVRLVQALAARYPDAPLRHAAVLPGRGAVAVLGGRVRVHYDQACLDPGPYDAGLRRYFGQRGRLRPDLTVVVELRDGGTRAVLVEAKLSVDPGYLTEAYRDAIVYRAEYGASLGGWPKVVLVTPGPAAGAPHRGDDVIAVGWDRWVPDEVLDGMLEGV